MDREQEDLQFLSFFGIFEESFKIIFSWRRIFSRITLSLILPLSIIFLAHIQISHILFSKIMHNQEARYFTRKDSPRYTQLSDIISSEWVAFWLFKVLYFTFLLILSLLSTAAVVYTIASIYTAKEITFRKVMSVVPKVWKRLMVTFLWSFAIVLVYNIASGVLFFIWAINFGLYGIGIAIFIFLCILYLVGFVYISIVWHLASVVSVLENLYGIKAMIKSKSLIKGKMGVAVAVFFMLVVLLIGVELLFENLVVLNLARNIGIRIGIGILSVLLLVKVFLFGLVVQTVIYFVCKSYHHENIDKSSLADHLEVYLGEYVPLTAKDVQLGEF
ncbi:hypothetical protein I3843_03G115800 [Carya illinoinensis]|uniref:Uncharacterized protein n=1 Tax=Carya illinoinensis TaxID=32201 RepID=A0A922JV43_CARIL|nr:hypothetical protein I3760_03G113900 [Carya illinoinensis]KAG6721551.1 hypothetical protein I3842_03G116800 [Carya illinoinensis]KAG7987107.1 hypothetical protein I3843_03G115800 [Carya illinoinensis]